MQYKPSKKHQEKSKNQQFKGMGKDRLCIEVEVVCEIMLSRNMKEMSFWDIEKNIIFSSPIRNDQKCEKW